MEILDVFENWIVDVKGHGMVYFNKLDLFKLKINEKNFREVFSDYKGIYNFTQKGENDSESILDFTKQQFVKRSEKKNVKFLFGSLLNEENVKELIRSLNPYDSILN